jgi:transposase
VGASLQHGRTSDLGVPTDGWPLPLFTPTLEQGVDQVIRDALKQAATPPQKRTAPPPPRWTLKRLQAWLEAQGQDGGGRETIRQALKRLGLSWKKARKLLNKADPDQRAAFLEQLQPLLVAATRGQRGLVYIDEAHFRQDTDEGYGWSIKGERFWVSSSSPGLGAKVSCYGVYFYHQGQVKLYPYDRANRETTVELLETLRRELPDTPLTVLWDGASYHRAKAVMQRAEELQIDVLPLSAYSPDFMPVEHLWQWIREDVTYHTCYHGFLIKISLAKASIPRRGLNPQISRWRPGSFSATFSGSTRRRCRATTP